VSEREERTSAGLVRAVRYAVLGGGAFLLNGVLLTHFSSQRGLGEIACAVGAVLLAVPLCLRALRSLRGERRPMDELVALAVLACFALGDYTTAAVVALLMLGAVALEEHTASGAWTEVESLLRMAPKRARRVGADGVLEEVPVSELKVGDTIRILPGDSVPADGTIREGASALVEATITGESLPADKTVGDPVFAGTLNVTGSLTVTVEKVGEDTTLARVRSLILGAKASRPRITSVFERYVGWYPPVVIMVAALVLFLSNDWARAITTVVASCPIALVIAVPSATVAALAAAYRAGLLVKAPRSFETAAEVTAVVVDKTGTLTFGDLAVLKAVGAAGGGEKDFVRYAAAVAGHSQHPVSKAVVQWARSNGIETPAAHGVREEPGRGLVGECEGAEVRLGRPDYLVASGVDLSPVRDSLKDVEGFSVLAVAVGGEAAGLFVLEDRIRPEAARTVGELRDLGVERVIMVTGDRRDVAERTAAGVGIREVVAPCLPEEKLSLVKELRESGLRVLVVGDGVNDAPALASGDLGVAVGAGASEIALESADVAIVRGGLESLGTLLRLGGRYRGVTGQNLLVGVALILSGVFLSGFGFLSPISAAVLQNLGALAVLLSSGRLVGGRKDADRA